MHTQTRSYALARGNTHIHKHTHTHTHKVIRAGIHIGFAEIQEWQIDERFMQVWATHIQAQRHKDTHPHTHIRTYVELEGDSDGAAADARDHGTEAHGAGIKHSHIYARTHTYAHAHTFGSRPSRSWIISGRWRTSARASNRTNSR